MHIKGIVFHQNPFTCSDLAAALTADIRAGGFVGTQQRQKPGKKFPDLIHGALLILEDNLEHPLAHTQALDTVSFHQIYLIYLGNEALLLLLIQKSGSKVNALPACSLGERCAEAAQIAVGHAVGNGHAVFFGQFFKSGCNHRNPSFYIIVYVAKILP